MLLSFLEVKNILHRRDHFPNKDLKFRGGLVLSFLEVKNILRQRDHFPNKVLKSRGGLVLDREYGLAENVFGCEVKSSESNDFVSLYLGFEEEEEEEWCKEKIRGRFGGVVWKEKKMDGLNREEQEEGLMVVMVRDHLHDLQPWQCLDQLGIGTGGDVFDDGTNRIGVLLDELSLLWGGPELEEVVVPLELLFQVRVHRDEHEYSNGFHEF